MLSLPPSSENVFSLKLPAPLRSPVSSLFLLSSFVLLSVLCLSKIREVLEALTHSASSHSKGLAFTLSVSSPLSLVSILALCPWLWFTLAFTLLRLVLVSALKKVHFLFAFRLKNVQRLLFSVISHAKECFFFCFLNDLRVKFWFLCDFLMEKEVFLRLGFGVTVLF